MKYIMLAKVTLWSLIERIKLMFESLIAPVIILLGSAILNFFGEDRVWLVKLTIILMAVDLVWGTISSIKRRTWLCSTFALSTSIKLLAIGSIFVGVAALEKAISNDFVWLSSAACIIFCYSELVSIIAHILIIKPNFPALRVFSKILQAEIAKKLKLSPQEINSNFVKYCDIEPHKKCNHCGACLKDN